ncbi:tetratricopeptide repeat protein [Massilia endophytica]|uniref:tetratricopeptide repeat protein n=1 Tax=Massilia endophytica TaxID=2899220 RepID=UPI001E3B68B0|nr:tetratricopeptide repeat protein [Massilia endophytica]UGQ47925.1 tetratricopeptide repeat protein [Massilia endophytica]
MMMKYRIPLAALVMLSSACIHAAPYIPRSGNEVLETLPARANARQLELVALRRQLDGRPSDAELASSLAQRYIALGRAETDPRYFGYAQAALSPWWRSAAPPTEVRLLRATLLQSTHRFGAALQDLDAIVASEPRNAQAWLTRATVQTVTGDYAGATASCARLSTIAETLAAVTCLANTASISGRLATSERLLATTLERNGDSSAELKPWSLTLLAEMAVRRGDTTAAEARFRSALAASPRDSYLLGAYADFLLDRKRPQEAADLLAPHRRIDALLLRYAIALKRMNSDPAGLRTSIGELRARFDAAVQRGDSVHEREHARFELELMQDGRKALALAQSNWQVQKEVADMRILLEAALHARNRAAAAPVLQWLDRHGVEDVTLASLRRQLGALS